MIPVVGDVICKGAVKAAKWVKKVEKAADKIADVERVVDKVKDARKGVLVYACILSFLMGDRAQSQALWNDAVQDAYNTKTHL